MTDEVEKWIQKENLIQKGDRVLVGLSGGADSVCLLLLLLELAGKMDVTIEAVHVEHGIRGEESLLDAQFAEDLCRREQVLCHTCHVDVPEYAAEHGIGLEEAARLLRYDSFRREAERMAVSGTCGRAVRIALAHHADDNAETMLFQMIRGSGVKGMGGMRPERGFTEQAVIIRPLLMVSRREIEAYLRERGEKFRCDSTNEDIHYSRNRLRHEVIPQLEWINSRAVQHMTKSAEMLRELSDYLQMQVDKLLPSVCTHSEDGWQIEKTLFADYPLLIQKEAVHRILEEAAGSRRDIGSVHVEKVLSLARLQVGRSISLPYRLCAVRVYDGIRIFKDGETTQEKSGFYEISREELMRAEQGEVVFIRLPDGEMRLRIFSFHGKIREIQKKRYTKWLNYDKIKCGLQIRRRSGSDYLVIDEEGHKKKLKAYFVGEKIPADIRNKIWLLAEASHIIWVIGGRISAGYKIEENTEKILEVQITGGNYYED